MRDQRTHDREEEYDGTLDDLQPALQSPAGQAAGADVLVPAGGVPERVLASPPDPKEQEKASRQRVALEASHGLSLQPHGTNRAISGYKKRNSLSVHSVIVFVCPPPIFMMEKDVPMIMNHQKKPHKLLKDAETKPCS